MYSNRLIPPIWDIVQQFRGPELRQFHDKAHVIAIDSSGDYVASGNDTHITIRNIRRNFTKQFTTGGRYITGILFHPQKSNILLTGDWDWKIRLWNSENAGPECHIGTSVTSPLGIHNAAWHPFDSGLLFTCTLASSNIICWDLEYMQQRFDLELEGHSGIVRNITSQTGYGLASAGSDGNIKLWDARTAACYDTIQSCAAPSRLVFHPYRPELVSLCFCVNAVIWDLRNLGTPVYPVSNELIGQMHRVCFSDTMLAGVVGKRIHLWDSENGYTYCGHYDLQSNVFSLAGGNNGILASGSDSHTQVWDVGQLLKFCKNSFVKT